MAAPCTISQRTVGFFTHDCCQCHAAPKTCCDLGVAALPCVAPMPAAFCSPQCPLKTVWTCFGAGNGGANGGHGNPTPYTHCLWACSHCEPLLALAQGFQRVPGVSMCTPGASLTGLYVQRSVWRPLLMQVVMGYMVDMATLHPTPTAYV